jgi:hypothetical protein
MKVGDMVMRKLEDLPSWRLQSALECHATNGQGMILSKKMAGDPVHPCVTVFYPKTNKTYDIAESLLVVTCEI